MVEIDDFELLYVPVPKAGCTTVKTALAPIMGADAETLTVQNVHPLLPTRRFDPKRFEALSGYWRITVVRDPIARLLSAYNDIVKSRGLLAQSANIQSGAAGLPGDPDPDFFFQNLDAYRSASSVVKHHVMKQIVFTGPDMAAYDMVYDLSNIRELGRDLSLMTGRIIDTSRALNESKGKLSLSDLDRRTRAALNEETAPDYAALGDVLAHAA